MRQSLEIALGKSLNEAITAKNLARVPHLSFRKHLRIAPNLPADLKNLEFLSIQNNQLSTLTLPDGMENLPIYTFGAIVLSL